MKAISMKSLIKIPLTLALMCWLILTSSIPGLSQKNPAGSDIVIIDSTLQNVGILLNSLKPGTKLFYLDKSEQLVTFISETVTNNAPVKSLHLLTHGAPGAIFTTSTFINYDILNKEKGEISKWKESFTSNGAILLYGCETGKGNAGFEFCKKLSNISGVNVFASNDRTGASNLGGNWVLEVSTSGTENPICFTQNILTYNHILGKVLVWSGPSWQSYATTVHNYYNAQSGLTSVQMVDNVNTIPDLSGYSMVFIVLPERAINATEINNLKALIDRGGRIIWVGENSYFVAMNTVITNAVAALGGHLSIQNLGLDNSCTYLPDIHINMSSPLMEGVAKLWGSAVSAINIGGDATVLVKMRDDPTKIAMAQERMGNGDIIAWADVNQWDVINDASFGTALFFRTLLNSAAERIQSILVASLTTTEAYSISGNSAYTGGNITNDNGSSITERGICWSTSTANPTPQIIRL